MANKRVIKGYAKNTGKKATIVFVGFEDTLTKYNIDGL